MVVWWCLKDHLGIAADFVLLLLSLPGLRTKTENGIEAGRAWVGSGPRQSEKQAKGLLVMGREW